MKKLKYLNEYWQQELSVWGSKATKNYILRTWSQKSFDEKECAKFKERRRRANECTSVHDWVMMRQWRRS